MHIYIRIIEIPRRTGERKSVKRHIITPKIMCILSKSHILSMSFGAAKAMIFISREREFFVFGKSQNSNNMYIYTEVKFELS